MSRKVAISNFLKQIKIIDGKEGHNFEMYEALFEVMTDKEWKELERKIEEDDYILPLYEPVIANKPIPLERVLKVGESLGIKWYQKLWLTDPVSGVKYLTNEEYPVMFSVIRRQKQHQVEGKSVMKKTNKTDNTTGQLTNTVKASSISLPELYVADAFGRKDAITEFMKVNGGDVAARKLARTRMIETGSYSLEEIRSMNTSPIVTETLSSFLYAMHYEHNLKG